ncbi:MAG TPA: 23S rRNA (pseudouridine(1915)-N(3))-methyltransferase RlmH [Terriglobia bacterium]|nr:23S rRNA (pseudouridine(1915)-N(3))-methyltransferase RlmH [Terriglobia bacterium]
MKLRVVWAGKTRDRNLAALTADFAGRARKFIPLDIVELKDSKSDSAGILAAIPSEDRVIALDPNGKTWTSAEFAAFLDRHIQYDRRPLTFVVGGPAGLDDAARKRAEISWSLSPLTFTHDMARFLLLEQIYRAMATLRNHPYPR